MEYAGGVVGSDTFGSAGLETYLNGKETWAFKLGLFVLILNLSLAPVLCFLIWKRRDCFPVNSTPAYLTITTQVGASLYVVSLIQSIVFPEIPCGLHIIISYADYFPFYSGTLVQLLSTWARFRWQKEMILATKRSRGWLERHIHSLSSIGQKQGLVILGAILFLLLTVTRLVSRRAYLGLPMTRSECLEFGSTAEAGLQRGIWWGLMGLNALLTYLIRDTNDAFNLNQNWKNIIFFFIMGAPLNAMATYATRLNDKERVNAYVLGQLAYVGAVFSYMWYGTANPVRLSYIKEAETALEREVAGMAAKRRQEQKACQPLKDSGEAMGNPGPGSERSDGGDEITFVSTPAELKAALQRPSILPIFKQYLVKEFAVENVIFIEALNELRSQTDPKLKLQVTLKIREDFLNKGSPYEINILDRLRSTIIAAIQEQTKEGTGENIDAHKLFDAVEEQVYRMLLDAYNRFVRGGSASAALIWRQSSSRLSVHRIQPSTMN